MKTAIEVLTELVALLEMKAEMQDARNAGHGQHAAALAAEYARRAPIAWDRARAMASMYHGHHSFSARRLWRVRAFFGHYRIARSYAGRWSAFNIARKFAWS
jgi:hypothetical protein